MPSERDGAHCSPGPGMASGVLGFLRSEIAIRCYQCVSGASGSVHSIKANIHRLHQYFYCRPNTQKDSPLEGSYLSPDR